MSPYLQRPLELGCDIVIHSATKFLCGHSDVMAGAVIVKDVAADDLYLIQNGEGGGLAPFDSFLVLRGMKTLALRQNQQQANATAIANYLQQHPSVTDVYFPTLAPPGAAAVYKKRASGPGSVLSFRTGRCGVVAPHGRRLQAAHHHGQLRGSQLDHQPAQLHVARQHPGASALAEADPPRPGPPFGRH